MHTRTTPHAAASKAAYAMRCIHRDIVAGDLQPGQKLAFHALTAKYEVGISPLREALCQLVGQGLVLLESQRGFRVTPISPHDLRDVAAMRRHLEVHAFRLSIANGDSRWKEELRRAAGAFKNVAAHDHDVRLINEAWESVHRDFHFALMSACGSPILLQLCKQIYDRFDRYRRLAILRQSNMLSVAADHDSMFEAALRGDQVEGERQLTVHLTAITDLVFSHFPELDVDGAVPR